MKLISNNLRATKSIAHNIAKNISKYNIILLQGDLGAGKTTFTQYLLRKLGVKEVINSPTFNIVKQYHTKNLTINHFDLYRIADESELVEVGFEELITLPNSLSIIEWPAIAKHYIRGQILNITISYNGDGRVFNMEEENV